MILPVFRSLRALPMPFLLVAAFLAATSRLCQAADASPWESGPQSAVRLIAASAAADSNAAVLRAGLEIKLQPGWKTYWRYPGDSGVPPRFNFEGSQNIRNVTVLWPAPMRFSDGSGTSIGYVDHTIFPLRIVRQDGNKPAVLRVTIDYAVCEKLCVPVDANLELALVAAVSLHEAALTASEARVPHAATMAASEPLAVASVRREPGSPRERVIVDVKAPADSPVDLFAEGPNTEWALPLPEPISGAPDGMKRFAFDLDGLPPGAQAKGALLKLTAVSPGAAIEVAAHLD
jgi:DsbC/DsbD-like thiol-disulfide interchange protein